MDIAFELVRHRLAGQHEQGNADDKRPFQKTESHPPYPVDPPEQNDPEHYRQEMPEKKEQQAGYNKDEYEG